MSNAWIIPIITSISFFLTAYLRNYALTRSLMDVPNARSSHSVPTPRGGGVAIVVTFLLSLALLFFFGVIPSADALAIAGAGSAIAVIGFMDDHGHIAARWRLLGHSAAAVWLLSWMGGGASLCAIGVSLRCWLVWSCVGGYLFNVAAQSLQFHGRHRWHRQCGSHLCLSRGLPTLLVIRTEQSDLGSTVARGLRRRFLVLEFPPRTHLHGRCRERVSRYRAGRAFPTSRLDKRVHAMGVDNSAWDFHC
jgi:hypothetical protein